MSIEDVKTREALTCDMGLGVGNHRLCGGGLTIRGGEGNLSGIEVELQPPHLVGNHGKPSVSFIRHMDEMEKLSAAA